MKKTLLSLTLLSACAMSGAQAAPVSIASGTLSFFGSITADSCTVTSPGNDGFLSNFIIQMGNVTPASLGTEANPATSAGSSAAISKSVDMQVNCAKGTKVALELEPNIASGKGAGLRAGGAENVQIMLVNDQTVLDFSPGKVTLDRPNTGGSVTIPLQAYYTLKSGATAQTVVPGEANATIGYTMSYE